MAVPELKLMIPGPVEIEADVLEALGRPVLPHYGPEWTQLYNETTTMLGRIFRTEGDIFILIGSGSSAIDACIGSALATGEQIIVGVNGFFGERVAPDTARARLESSIFMQTYRPYYARAS